MTTVPAVALPYLLTRLWQHFSLRRKYQFGLLMTLMLISAFAEVVSLGAVVPFLGVLVAPEAVFGHPVVAKLTQNWSITSSNQLVLPLTALFITAALLAGLIRILLLWVGTRLAYSCGADLSIEVYRHTLYQPYRVHQSRNSGEVVSSIVNKVNSAVFGVLISSLTLITSIVMLISLSVVLITVDPIVATVTGATFGGSYALIIWVSRRYLQSNGRLIALEQTQVIRAIQEGLGGIRDVLLGNTQSIYCDIYRQADYPLRRAQCSNAFIGSSPRPAMETLVMVMIAILAFVFSQQVGGITAAIPVLGALALGAQRLLPALQQAYGAWANIVGSHASLADVISMLDQPLPADLLGPPPAPLILEKSIQFRDVKFRYVDEGPWILNKLNLSISKGERVGIVGSTGSGKSTMLDVLMGLLIPSEGELLIDGKPISDNRIKAWQQSIGHVPQSVYLADTTIAENIAFGVPSKFIDLGRVRQAAQQAQIADFIESGKSGYQATVGERGVRLSGGQRQRIGIARALYKNANILVFDEATSALDNATEQSVMDAIKGLNSNFTVLMIAHRLSTIKHCDKIIELNQGQTISQGTYEFLLENSPSFYKMANQKNRS